MISVGHSDGAICSSEVFLEVFLDGEAERGGVLCEGLGCLGIEFGMVVVMFVRIFLLGNDFIA